MSFNDELTKRVYALSETNGPPLKILRKNLTTLTHTWSVLSFSNLVPTSHTSDITLDRARLIYDIIQKMDMNLGLNPAINLAYVKKNYWNLDDLSVTFWGSRKTNGKRSKSPPSSALPIPAHFTSTTAPSIPAPALASTPLPVPTLVSTGSSSFSYETLFAMLQSLHKGQIIIMQCLQSSGLQVAWPGVQPSSSGGGEASAAQEPVLEEDEPIPPEPFVYETDPTSAQEEVASPESVPQSSPSPTTILDDIPEPSALALVSDQPIVQDPLVTPESIIHRKTWFKAKITPNLGESHLKASLPQILGSYWVKRNGMIPVIRVSLIGINDKICTISGQKRLKF
ncbi:hypothetical protein GmHk_19G054432 [Glycine max]|nr:hypothetical protein GmHk_19G054432 [Glycine max]